MTFEKILEELKNKIYHPLYFLMGDEPYFIDLISGYIEKNVLTESEKSFNQTVVYGNDIDVGNLSNTARRYPMMAQYQVVIVKEAQNLKNIDDLVYYVEKPLKSTILVINYKYKKLDKRKKLYTALSKNGIVFESSKLYENQVPDWITVFLKNKGLTIQPAAALLIAEFLGTDLGKIVNELEKLIISIPSGEKVITSLHIEQNIGISKDYNNFELHNALISKDALKAFRIVDYFDKNPKNNPLIVTITSLFYFFSKVLHYHSLKDKSKQVVAAALKINPYFVSDYQKAARSFPPGNVIQIISYLREYDLKSKGIGNLSASDGDLLKELIFKILH